ncbi:MAG: dTDP-4-dehydrorhamnose reductase [Bacilli bacterium]|nr:dTDP-4-dehydrorhamnose reductase [Bacilli bacterium]
MKIINTMDEEYKKLIDGKEFFGEGLEDCYVIVADKFGDSRGFFSPRFIQKELDENIPNKVFEGTVQENASKSQKGVIRGLHYQLDPKCQTKLVGVTEGEAIDVIVDIRPDSPTFKKWLGIKLRPYEKQLLVPKGFAHGFIALKDNTIFHYLVDNDYAPNMEAGIPWDDKSVNIDWKSIFESNDIKENELLTSDKDKMHSTLDEKIKNDEIPFKKSDLKPSEKYYNSRCKVMVTGGAGQLGYDVIKELEKRGYKDIYAPTIEELDLTDKEAVDKYMDEIKPNLVIHCAAYTAVDAAEDDKEKAGNINIDATDYISNKCKEFDSKLIYISTDYVFDGNKDLNEVYEVTDETNPQSVYGLTKLMGERKALNNPKTFVVRTSWVFGINGKNFMKTMLNLSETKNELNVVSDQYGSPTYTVDLARLLVDMVGTEKYGLYHANNEGYCNWAEFAEEIFRQNKKNVKVNHVTSEEYPQKAYRPKNSKLSKNALIDNDFDLLPAWKDAVRRYSKELKLNK